MRRSRLRSSSSVSSIFGCIALVQFRINRSLGHLIGFGNNNARGFPVLKSRQCLHGPTAHAHTSPDDFIVSNANYSEHCVSTLSSALSRGSRSISPWKSKQIGKRATSSCFDSSRTVCCHRCGCRYSKNFLQTPIIRQMQRLTIVFILIPGIWYNYNGGPSRTHREIFVADEAYNDANAKDYQGELIRVPHELNNYTPPYYGPRDIFHPRTVNRSSMAFHELQAKIRTGTALKVSQNSIGPLLAMMSSTLIRANLYNLPKSSVGVSNSRFKQSSTSLIFKLIFESSSKERRDDERQVRKMAALNKQCRIVRWRWGVEFGDALEPLRSEGFARNGGDSPRRTTGVEEDLAESNLPDFRVHVKPPSLTPWLKVVLQPFKGGHVPPGLPIGFRKDPSQQLHQEINLLGKTKILRPKTLKSVHFCGRKNKIENTKNANISERSFEIRLKSKPSGCQNTIAPLYIIINSGARTSIGAGTFQREHSQVRDAIVSLGVGNSKWIQHCYIIPSQSPRFDLPEFIVWPLDMKPNYRIAALFNIFDPDVTNTPNGRPPSPPHEVRFRRSLELRHSVVA
ncbi:unnamed protein product [Nesidiocoris tenuis]|uniref:Uncharacterized protein n=1 Tax=Nesidiocoris tenuis TaxID=355587 RepID=A0A6H5HHN9_9HEMI|nr:unnamed protein product [Nesidiocoris tenuis]